MIYALQLSAAAKDDLDEARLWHEHSRLGAGDDFMHSVNDALVRIRHLPETCPLVYANYRRTLVRRFSYAIYFRIQQQRIIVSAIVHTSRSPSAWKKHLPAH